MFLFFIHPKTGLSEAEANYHPHPPPMAHIFTPLTSLGHIDSRLRMK